MAQKPNRLFAALSYLLPFIGSAAVLLFERRNVFALYHACQAFAIAAFAVLLPAGWLLMSWAIAWVPMAGPTFSAATFTIVMAGLATLLVLSIVGIANALGSKMTPLFLVGKWGERLFVRLFPEPVVESKA